MTKAFARAEARDAHYRAILCVVGVLRIVSDRDPDNVVRVHPVAALNNAAAFQRYAAKHVDGGIATMRQVRARRAS